MGGAQISNASFPMVGDITLVQDSLLLGKTIVLKGNSGTGGNIIIHTVTAGKTFYLLSACLSIQSTAIDTVGYLHIGAQANKMLYVAVGNAAGQSAVAVSFSHPIPVAALTNIALSQESGTGEVFGSITGWEE